MALRWPENQIRTPDERVICYVKGFAYASLDPLPSGEGVVDPEIFLGNNMAIRRCALSGKRPFDEGTGPSPGLYRMGGMAPVFQYLREQNHQSIYLPAMSVEHLVRKEQMSFEWILRRSRSWGRSLAFFGNQFRDINGAASVPSILRMLAFRAFRCARLSLKQTKYPGYWARIDIEILLGILSEKLRIEK